MGVGASRRIAAAAWSPEKAKAPQARTLGHGSSAMVPCMSSALAPPMEARAHGLQTFATAQLGRLHHKAKSHERDKLRRGELLS